jgi:hypothetical protein
MELSLEIDSAAFQGIYGQVSNAKKEGIKVKTEDEFSTLTIELSGKPEEYKSAPVVVMLVDSGDKIVKQKKADDDGVVTFRYLNAGKYYVRAMIDLNDNGIWDTGCYDEGLQPEPVFYNTEQIECKVKWDVSRKWNLTSTPRYKQKPAAITKQKPETAKKQRSRNLERAKEKGKAYLKGKGVNL